MSSLRTRALVSAVSAAVAAAAAAAWLVSRPRSEAIRLKDDGIAAQKLLLDRKREPLAAPRPGERAVRTLREPLDSDSVKSLWAFDEAYHEYDPSVYFRYKPGLDLAFGDRDGVGRYHVHTSEDGYREDFVRLPAKRDLFVVVVGDSHTDGVCENRQTFANRLEAKLLDRHPGKAIEVLNTGVTGYSFYHYLGSLERHLDLKPDAFVVAFYGGNDFLDVIKPWHYFHHTAPPPRSREYWSRLSRARELSGSLVGNAFNELLYFHTNAGEIETALRAAKEVCEDIVRLCREHGIVPVFVHIPPQVHGTGERRERFERILRALELTDGDCALFDRLADALIARLRELDVRIVDLRKDFAGDEGRYYWTDLHIDVEAHEKIADLLLPIVDGACPVR